MTHRITAALLLCLASCLASLGTPSAARAWEPNAKDREAAIDSGDLTDYTEKLTEWLQSKVPADPAAITRDVLQNLLRDQAFVDALAERQFLAKVWERPDLATYAKADPKNRAFVSWLLANGRIMDEFLITRTPTDMHGRNDNSWSINTGMLENWRIIQEAHPDSKQGLLLRLAMATVLRPPGTGNQGAGMAKQPSPPLARFEHFKTAHEKGELAPTFDALSTWELTQVVSSNASDADLGWARQAVLTWNPDYYRHDNIMLLGSQMKYQGSQIPYNSMSCLLAGGGKCGPRSSFGVFINQAFGIPAMGVGQPGHAAVCYRDRHGNWQVAMGKGWNVSKVSDRGGMSGAEFLERTKERKMSTFAHVEHLRWLAALLPDKPRKDAITAVVPNVSEGDYDVLSGLRAELAAKPPVAAKPEDKPAAKPAPKVDVPPGTIHVEAGDFYDMGGLGGYGAPVAAIDSYEGGKQVHFGALIQTAWVGYKIKVPKTGFYELTARVSVINWGQRLYARSFGAMHPVKSATASDVFKQMTKDLGGQMATDHSLATRWAMNLGKEQGTLELDLGEPRTISKMLIDERSWDRVSAFRVEYKEGEEWKLLFEGRDIGEFKKEFPPVTAQYVRLVLLDGKAPSGGPTIWDVSVGEVFDGNGWIEADWSAETAGLWQTTKPIEMRLTEGEQTFWICAPGQRGMSLKSFDLTPKEVRN